MNKKNVAYILVHKYRLSYRNVYELTGVNHKTITTRHPSEITQQDHSDAYRVVDDLIPKGTSANDFNKVQLLDKRLLRQVAAVLVTSFGLSSRKAQELTGVARSTVLSEVKEKRTYEGFIHRAAGILNHHRLRVTDEVFQYRCSVAYFYLLKIQELEDGAPTADEIEKRLGVKREQAENLTLVNSYHADLIWHMSRYLSRKTVDLAINELITQGK